MRKSISGKAGFFTKTFALMVLICAPLCANPMEPVVVTAPYAGSPREAADFPRPLRKRGDAAPTRLDRGVPAVVPSQISGLERPETQRYVQRYASQGSREWLNSVMQNAKPYIAFIRREIDSRGFPAELLYLPVIESGFVGRARSPAGAAGLWQFMRNSMTPFDMQVTEWVDERFDFWKATIGAMGKLDENRRALGDWALALAAYNMGLGGIRSVIRRATGEEVDYWALLEQGLLKTETSVYIPKLLAVSHVLRHPRQYGLPVHWYENPDWTRVKTGRIVDVRELAKYAGVDPDELFRANQELLYAVTPPDAEYHLKVRAADADKVAAALERKDIALIKYHVYIIKSGDTLSEISEHYGVSVSAIMENNTGLKPHALQIGKRLVIPSFKDIAPYEGSKRTVSARTASPGSKPAENPSGTHIVKKGETLWSISRAYSVSMEEIARLNNINLEDTLSVGKTLKLPIK